MGCVFGQQVIYPGESAKPCNKQSRKAIIINSKANYEYVYCCQSRDNISNATENIYEVREPINGEALVLVQRAISKHFLFYGLNQNQRHELIKLMRRYSAFKNQYIFRKGDAATTFFIIISGKVQIQTGLQSPAYLYKGQSFGELALIYEAPRSVSVVAREQTILWGIQSHIFNRYMNRLKQKNFALIRKFLDKVSFFTFLSQKQKQNIVLSSHRFKYEAGSKIFSIRDPANSIFIVIDGRIQMQIPNKSKVLFEKGQMFGEGCLLGYQFRSGTAWCIQQTQCLSISKNALLKELGVQANNILLYCICKWSLKRSSIFNLLKRTTIDRIIFSGQMKLVEDSDVLQEKGKPTQRLFICLQGKINNSGVGSIFNEVPEQSGTQNLIKNGRGNIFTIKFEILTRIINRPLKAFVQTKQKRVKIKTEHMSSIEDFLIISKTQQNYLSEMFLVSTHSQPKSRYLMHCLNKNNIIDTEQQVKIYDYIKNLQALKQHYLIPKIVKIFPNDPYYIFLVRQYTGVCRLSDILQQKQAIDKNGRYYCACIVEIVEHLHCNGLVHRNINPNSFIVGQNGYLYADELFQIDKIPQKSNSSVGGKHNCQQSPQQFHRTGSIIGLPHYLAPEVIFGASHTTKSDLWSLGVLFYQILFGCLPYGSQCNDVMEIYADILNNTLTFNQDNQGSANLEQKQIINSLLKIEEGQRTEIGKLRQKKYFKGVDFEKLRKFQQQLLEIDSKKCIQNHKIINFSGQISNSLNDYLLVDKKIFGQPKNTCKVDWSSFQQ